MIDIAVELKENGAVLANNEYVGRPPLPVMLTDPFSRTKRSPMRKPATKRAAPKATSTRQQEREQELEQGLAGVRALLEQADIDGARAALEPLKAVWPESERVQRLSRLIAPPVLRVVPGDLRHSRTADHQWLRDHLHEHAGQWVAVLNGQLIASDSELAPVYEQAEHAGRPDEVLLHFQPSHVNWP